MTTVAAVPRRGEDLEAEPAVDVGERTDGAEAKILLHDGQAVLRPLPVHQLVVLDREPSPGKHRVEVVIAAGKGPVLRKAGSPRHG